MNKKIYFDNNFVLISDEKNQPSGNQLIIDFETSNTIFFQQTITDFISKKHEKNLLISCKNCVSAFEKLKTRFLFIEAAGGIIKQKDKYLFIYRFNKWDFPKGKLEKNERPSQAAIRECEEECAVSGLTLISELPSTYHIYPFKNNFALKTTYWFLMESNYEGKLVPQAEEDIQKAEWMDNEKIHTIVLKNTYPSVIDLISIIIPA